MSSKRDEILEQLRMLLAEATSEPGLIDEMEAVFASAQSTAQPDRDDDGSFFGMVGECPALLEVRELCKKFARVNAPVLVRGESGTGKDLVARAIHELSPRKRHTLVSENCAAIPETLLESVLFGHVRGAFTGAVRDHPGHFVAAHKGTLFLDEIGDMPLPMQAKLLRALQEGEVRPVGGTKVKKVDVRVIAATNQDLERMVKVGKFREDLYYRLNVLEIGLPPLRDRGDDVVLLARRFLAHATGNSRSLVFTSDAEDRLRDARWAGNIRQLQNEIQRLAALSDGPEISASAISPDVG